MQDAALLAAAEVVAEPVESFAGRVLASAARAGHARAGAAHGAGDGSALVLVSPGRANGGAAPFLARLEETGLGHWVLDPGEALGELAVELDAQGILVLDDADPRTRLRECRTVMLKRKERAPACGIWSPAGGVPSLPGVQVISGPADAGFDAFLEAVRARAAA